MSKSTITLFALCLALCSSALASSVPNSPWTSGEYDYDGSGNIRAIGPERFVYDPLGRLVSGSVGGKTQTYEYDGFGNLKKVAVAGGPTRQVPINSQTNRLSSVMYDAAGNQLNDGLVTQVRTYDAFNSMTVNLDGTQYLYDANDERIAIANPERTEWRYTIRDASAKVMREFVETGPAGGLMTLNWKRDYVYRGSALLGSYVKEGATTKRLHYHLDHLGTPRLTTDAAAIGRFAVADYPFGEEVEPITNTSETRRFTGHERDYNAGGTLDYMHARYYSPDNGRFLSIDPTWASADLDQPQSWNRYSYVLNNPVNMTDPDGKLPFLAQVVVEVAIDFVTDGSPTGSDADKPPRSQAEFDRRVASGRAIRTTTYQTYTKTNPVTGEVYSGRTSGTGAPGQNVARRDANHHKNAEGFGPAQLDKSSKSKAAIRGREQQLIDANGGARSKGGTSGNAIDGISSRNRNKPRYMKEAVREFGELVRKAVL